MKEEEIFKQFENKQAGAELCQAHFKLGLAKPALPDVDGAFPVFTNKRLVVFHLPKN
jgi:hypothetical protein